MSDYAATPGQKLRLCSAQKVSVCLEISLCGNCWPFFSCCSNSHCLLSSMTLWSPSMFTRTARGTFCSPTAERRALERHWNWVKLTNVDRWAWNYHPVDRELLTSLCYYVLWAFSPTPFSLPLPNCHNSHHHQCKYKQLSQLMQLITTIQNHAAEHKSRSSCKLTQLT